MKGERKWSVDVREWIKSVCFLCIANKGEKSYIHKVCVCVCVCTHVHAWMDIWAFKYAPHTVSVFVNVCVCRVNCVFTLTGRRAVSLRGSLVGVWKSDRTALCMASETGSSQPCPSLPPTHIPTPTHTQSVQYHPVSVTFKLSQFHNPIVTSAALTVSLFLTARFTVHLICSIRRLNYIIMSLIFQQSAF